MGITYNPFSLEGKTILVTGASSGIGRATAIECSKMRANVIITGRSQERLQETFNQLEGNGHMQVTAELTNQEEIKNLVEQLPLLNGVVLCAGSGLTLPIKNAKQEKFQWVFDVNFFSPVDVFRQLVVKKKITNGASVLFISSIGGNFVFEPGNALYGTSKAALASFVKYAAVEFSGRLIRVNAICPGMVETPLIRRGVFTEEQLKDYESKYLLSRFGKPEEIAYAAIYLLSDAAAWTTGTMMVIDGGSTIKG